VEFKCRNCLNKTMTTSWLTRKPRSNFAPPPPHVDYYLDYTGFQFCRISTNNEALIVVPALKAVWEQPGLNSARLIWLYGSVAWTAASRRTLPEWTPRLHGFTRTQTVGLEDTRPRKCFNNASFMHSIHRRALQRRGCFYFHGSYSRWIEMHRRNIWMPAGRRRMPLAGLSRIGAVRNSVQFRIYMCLYICIYIYVYIYMCIYFTVY